MSTSRRPAGAGTGTPTGLGAPRAGGVSALDTAPFGWAPLVILVAVGIVDAMESRIIAGALHEIQTEFGIGDAAAGAIPTAVTIAGAIVTLPAGFLADRRHRTDLMAFIVLSWTVLLLGSALAVSFAMFFVVRVVLGAADSIDNPSSGSLLADYYPPLTRAKVFGWARLTTYAGGAVGTIFGGVVAQTLGWRWAYALMIVPGVVCAALLWRLREPARGFIDQLVARDTREPVPAPPSPDDEPRPLRQRLGHAFTGRGAPADDDQARAQGRSAQGVRFVDQLRYVGRIPTLRLLTLGLVAMSFGLGGIIFWVPTLIVRRFEVGTDVAGSIAGGVALVGLVAGHLYGSRLGRLWHGTRKGGRLLAGGGGLLIGGVLLGVAIGQPTLGRFALVLLLSTGFSALAIPNLMASVADVVIASSRGIGFSILQFLVAGAAAWSPLIVGVISDATGSLLTGMYALVVPGVFGGILVLAARGHFDHDAGRVLDVARGDADAGT